MTQAKLAISGYFPVLVRALTLAGQECRTVGPVGLGAVPGIDPQSDPGVEGVGDVLGRRTVGLRVEFVAGVSLGVHLGVDDVVVRPLGDGVVVEAGQERGLVHPGGRGHRFVVDRLGNDGRQLRRCAH